MGKRQVTTLLLGLLLCMLLISAACAISVSPSADTAVLVRALLGSNAGLAIRPDECGLVYCSKDGAVSCGTYTNASGVYGVGPGLVLSTGDVSHCSDSAQATLSYAFGSTATADINALLTPVTGSSAHYDATLLDISFDLLPGYDGISLDGVFGSEEYPRWQNTQFNDGMGIYLNGQNIGFVYGSPLNIDNPYVYNAALIPGIGATPLDGVLAPGDNPLLHFAGAVRESSQHNHLTLVIGDASDYSFDTVAFIGNLRATPVPEPSSLLALGVMSAGAMLAALRRRLR